MTVGKVVCLFQFPFRGSEIQRLLSSNVAVRFGHDIRVHERPQPGRPITRTVLWLANLRGHLHPAGLPDIAINLFWHAKYNRDPGNMWMQQLFLEMFADSKTK